MGCYNIYIFNRAGTCLFYHEWSRPKSVKQGAGTPGDDQKMMFGLFFSIKDFAATMDPKTETKQLKAQLKIGESCTFSNFLTNNYKLHFFESPSGIKIVLNTDPGMKDLKEELLHIYSNIYGEYVIKNPIYEPGRPFNFEHFTRALNSYTAALS